MVKNNKNQNKDEDIQKDIEENINTSMDESVEENIENAVEDEVNILQEEIGNLKNDMLRILADTENTKRRLIQEADKNSKYAISSFAKNLLPVADNMQRAMEASEPCPLLDGIKLTYDELLKVLAKFEVVPMDCLDKPFDPNFHQVISEVVDPSKEAGTIVQVLQGGYLISDRILREAMVIVSKK